MGGKLGHVLLPLSGGSPAAVLRHRIELRAAEFPAALHTSGLPVPGSECESCSRQKAKVRPFFTLRSPPADRLPAVFN